MKKRAIMPGPEVPLPPFMTGSVQSVARASDSQSDKRTEETPSQTGAEPAIQQAGGERAARDLISLDPDLIDQNPFAPREIYTPEMVLQRAEDLRKYGQNDPIHVIHNPGHPGRYIIADGWTRVLACRTHGALKTLWAYVHHGLTPEQAAWLGYTQNESRKQHSDYDRGMFYAKMINNGMSVNDVAQMAGITTVYLRMYRAFAKLPEEIVEIIRGNPDKFGPFAANELYKLYDKAGIRKAVSVALQFVSEDRPVRWLAAQVQAASTTKPHKGTPVIRQIRFGNGYFRLKGNRVELSLDVAPELVSDFADRLESMLKDVAKPVEHDAPPAHEEAANAEPAAQEEAGEAP